MPEIRGVPHDCSVPRRENVCIDSYRILDSCKDKDCFEDTKLLLTDYGQELIDKSGTVRVANTEVIWTDITVDPVRFNKGFYQIGIRYYTRVILEVCTCMGKIQEIEGIAINDKTAVLFGGCGNVSTFRSSGTPGDFCMVNNDEVKISGNPTVVVEVVDPIALSVKVTEQKPQHCCICCCSAGELPPKVLKCMNGHPADVEAGKGVYVTLGFFSVIRMERPAQLVVSATEYCVPDKVCMQGSDEDPCKVFAKMSFPVSEFCSFGACDKK